MLTSTVPNHVRRRFLVTALCLLATASPLHARELVRVRVSELSGAEPATIDSASHPSLFELDATIASAELRATNPASPSKSNFGPARFLPDLSPATPGVEAGTITLIVTPKPGSSVIPDTLRFTAAAAFASNPSSLQVRWNRDSLVKLIDLVDLAAPATRQIALGAHPPSDLEFSVQWTAGDDFGAFGGGPAGFIDDDIILDADTCAQAVATGCLDAPRGSLRLTKPDDAGRSNFAWSWTGGTASVADLGDPTAATGYALCVYEGGALVQTVAIPAAGSCGTKPCWKASSAGRFSYNDKSGTRSGIVSATLKPGTGNAVVSLRGRGRNLHPPLPLSGSQDVVVQLVRTDSSTCWSTTFATPAKTSTDQRFEDRR